MGRRIHAVCVVVNSELRRPRRERVERRGHRRRAVPRACGRLPGFGDEKSRIFVALLGKRMGVQPEGWRDAAGKFGDDTPRSVADSTSPETLAAVRQWKRAQKAARLDKQDRPL